MRIGDVDNLWKGPPGHVINPRPLCCPQKTKTLGRLTKPTESTG